MDPLSEASRSLLVAAVLIAGGFGWQALRTAAIPVSAPERLVAELRLAQAGALLLAATAAVYIGLAVRLEHVPGTALDIAVALGFGVVAGWTLVRDPRQALTVLAAAFITHALIDVIHRPGVLPEGLAPRWYMLGCAFFNLASAAICYWPVLRR